MTRWFIGAALGLMAVAIPADGQELVLNSGFVDSDGERIYYESVGDGEPLVLSHGLGGNHAIWYQQTPILGRNYRVITWDQRGFGRSTNEAGAASPAKAVEDLRAVLDALKVERAHLVGQSMGGWAVLGFALKYPERVASLVMADTIGGIYTDEVAAHFDTYIREAMAAPPVEEWPITRHPALGDRLGQVDPAKAFLYREIGNVAGPAPANMGLLLRQTSYPLEEVGALDLPVLFVVGENDAIFPPPIIRSAASQVPGAKVLELRGAGHSPYFETPEAWNDAVRAFLGKVPE